ncbi:DNA-directed RNA polymerase V subunit 5A, partial [Zostera marina]
MENLIDRGSVESGRYHLARRTLYEMLQDRGYAVATSDINMNLDDFRANFGDKPDPTSLQFSASLLSDTSKQILVMFCGEEEIKVKTITEISSQIDKDTWSRLILVVQNNLKAQARQAVKENFPFKVEIFQ